MSGRHRDNSLSWRLPSVVGFAAVLVLVAVVWLTGLPFFGDSDDSPVPHAAAALTRGSTSSRDTTSTPLPTSTSTTPPTSSTTTTTSAPTATTRLTSTTPPPTSTRQPSTTSPPATTCATELAGTRPHVAMVGNRVKQHFGVNTVEGRSARAGGGDHPAGLALDFMVDTATGNNLADYVLAHQSEFGVKYVIWRQRINMGSGWEAMEDRGSPTANHYDHVHVSFEAGAEVSVAC